MHQRGLLSKLSKTNKEERSEKIAEGGGVSERSSLLGNAVRGFGALERWLGYLGMAFLIGLMAMVVLEVVSRYVFGNPIMGYIDIMRMMMAVMVFLTLAYCQREGGHIRMELFMTRVLKGGRRYHLVEFSHLLLSLAGFGAIAISSLNGALQDYAVGDVTAVLYWPTWPAKMLVAIGAIFLCVRFILQMFYSMSQVVVGIKKTD